MEELAALVEAWDADPEVRCIVIAGGDEVFAAGADIKAMAERSFQDVLVSPTARFWPRLAAIRTPLIAAVSGYALGGGCELALACDLIVASETAEFGQPEILLGIIPGGGGTQRLARVMGKQHAMELVLTGRRITAEEAFRLGIVNQVTDKKEWLSKAIELAQVVSPPPADRGAPRQAGGAGRRGDRADRRARLRAAPLRAGDGDRGPRRGHAGVPREAAPGLQGALVTAIRLGVVGAGTMGAGIAQLGCAAGMETVLHDPVPEALERGAEQVRKGLAKWAEKGRADAGAAELLRTRSRAGGPGRLRPRDRGGAGAARAEARAVRAAVGGLRRGHGARHQHLLDPGHLAGERGRAAGERGGHALLQPGAR